MKYQAKAGALLDGLLPVIKVAMTKGLVGSLHLSHMSIRARSNDLLAAATNEVTFIRRSLSDLSPVGLDYLCLEEGKATVDAKEMLETLKSFGPSDLLCIESRAGGEGAELVLAIKGRPEQSQTLPYREEIPDEAPTTSLNRQVCIRRDAFLYGVSRILFAASNEEHKELFQHWALTVADDKARFCAGTGGRFALLELGGDDLFTATPAGEIFLISAAQTPLITKMLASSADRYILLGLFEADSMLLIHATEADILLRIDKTLIWPNPEQVVNAEHEYDWKLTVAADELRSLIKGTMAIDTFVPRRQNDVVEALVTLNTGEKTIAVKAGSRLTSSRKAAVIDLQGDLAEPAFRVFSPSLAFAQKGQPRNGYVQIQRRKPREGKGTPVVMWQFAGQVVRPVNQLVRTNEMLGVKEAYCFFIGSEAAPVTVPSPPAGPPPVPVASISTGGPAREQPGQAPADGTESPHDHHATPSQSSGGSRPGKETGEGAGRPCPPLKWYGGKRKLAKHLLRFIPSHRTYVELCGGSGALLFAKEPSRVEVFNDINLDVVNLYRVLRDPDKLRLLEEALALTPDHQEEHRLSKDRPEELGDVERARRFLVDVRMSFNGVPGTTFSRSKKLNVATRLPNVSQNFVAGESAYEDRRGEPVDSSLLLVDGVEATLPFEMVQPDDQSARLGKG